MRLAINRRIDRALNSLLCGPVIGIRDRYGEPVSGECTQRKMRCHDSGVIQLTIDGHVIVAFQSDSSVPMDAAASAMTRRDKCRIRPFQRVWPHPHPCVFVLSLN